MGFQTTLFNDMRPFGVMAQVMVLFAACAGVVYGAEIGAVAGLIIGLMYDCVLTTPLGLASLVLGATAFVAGAFPYFVRDSSWWNKAIAVAVLGSDSDATKQSDAPFAFSRHRGLGVDGDADCSNVVLASSESRER